MQVDDVGSVTEQPARVAEAEACGVGRERTAQAAVPHNDQPDTRILSPNRRERFEQDVESLLRLEPADGSDGELVVADAKRLSHLKLTCAVALEGDVIDAVEHRYDVAGSGAVLDQLVPDIARDSNHPRK